MNRAMVPFCLLVSTCLSSAAQTTQSSPLPNSWIVTEDFFGAPRYLRLQLDEYEGKLTGKLNGDSLEGTLSGDEIHFFAHHGKVKALQWLLTHSFHDRVLAVKRVTHNQGKNTPGVDGAIWSTPASRYKAIDTLRRRGYQPQPLRRVYIPKARYVGFVVESHWKKAL